MDTIKLGFTERELLARRRYIGGSDATILMAGEEAAIHDLWARKTGRAEETDLSDVLPVQMGIWTEPLNVRWFERTSPHKVRSRNLLCPHRTIPFLACNLDGLTFTQGNDPAVFEAKHVNAFSNIDDVIQKYMAQTHHNMFCADVRHAILSVFIGTLKYEVAEIAMDDWYLAQLVDREKAFWACVEKGEPPPRLKPIAAPVPVSGLREVDMTGSNHWANYADIWKENRPAAERFKFAEKELKARVDDDVKLAHGNGIRVSRARNGALTIKNMEV